MIDTSTWTLLSFFQFDLIWFELILALKKSSQCDCIFSLDHGLDLSISIFEINRPGVPTEVRSLSVLWFWGFILAELRRKVSIHQSEAELDLRRLGWLSQLIEIRSKILFHLADIVEVERSWVGVDGVMADVDTAHLFDLLEQRHDHIRVVLHLRRELVLFTDLDPLEFDNQACVHIVLWLEDHLIIIEHKLASLRVLCIDSPYHFQVFSVLELWCVVLCRRAETYCHEVVVVLVGVGDGQLVDGKVYSEELVVLGHVFQGEEVLCVVLGESHSLEKVLLHLVGGIAGCKTLKFQIPV